jgi:hypothetical protein
MHTCTACFRARDLHPETCDCGEKHFPPLCCPGCDCRSFERAHPAPKDASEACPHGAHQGRGCQVACLNCGCSCCHHNWEEQGFEGITSHCSGPAYNEDTDCPSDCKHFRGSEG